MTTSILIQPEARTVIVGVDTHKHVHVAVAIDGVGALIQRGGRAVAGMLTIATAGGS